MLGISSNLILKYVFLRSLTGAAAEPAK